MLSKKVYLLDTNIMLRFLLDDHPEFSSKARTFFKALYDKEKKALILDCVLAECVYVLDKFYKVRKGEIAEKLTGILRFEGIINNDRHQLGNALHLYAHGKIDIVDAILASKSSKDMIVVSWDDDIRKITQNYERI